MGPAEIKAVGNLGRASYSRRRLKPEGLGHRPFEEEKRKAEDLDNLKTDCEGLTVILTTFQGITLQTTPKLRRECKKLRQYQVVKNTLAERAGTGTPPKAS